jgi:hypothetical protein
MSAIITIDKNQLKNADIDTTNIYHPATYIPLCTTNSISDNNGTINSNLTINLVKCTITIEADSNNQATFNVTKNEGLNVEQYSYTTKNKNIKIQFNNDSVDYDGKNTFIFKNSNANNRLKLLCDLSTNSGNSYNTETKLLTILNGNITFIYPTNSTSPINQITQMNQVTQSSTKMPSSKSPVDESMDRMINFFLDFILDSTVVFFLWLILLQLFLKWAEVKPEVMYPVDVKNDKPYCVEKKNFGPAPEDNNFAYVYDSINIEEDKVGSAEIRGKQECKKDNSENKFEFFGIFFEILNKNVNNLKSEEIDTTQDKSNFKIKSVNELGFSKFSPYIFFNIICDNIYRCYQLLNVLHTPLNSVYGMVNNSQLLNYKFSFFRLKDLFFCGMLISLQQAIKNSLKSSKNSLNVTDKVSQWFMKIIFSYLFMFIFPIFLLCFVAGYLSNIVTLFKTSFFTRVLIFNLLVGILYLIALPFIIRLSYQLYQKIRYNKDVKIKGLNTNQTNIAQYIFLAFLFIPVGISLYISFKTLFNLFSSSLTLFKEIDLIKPYILPLIIALFSVLIMDVSQVDHKYLISWTFLIIVCIGLFVNFNK